MRPALHLALQSGLWALAPLLDEAGVMDSPSLLLMPLSAALAAVASSDWRWGFGMPVAALGVVIVGYSAWTLASGRETLDGAVAFAVGILVFHVLATWVLLALFWWPGRKVRRLVGTSA